MKKNKLILMAALAACTLSLAGCGSSKKAEETTAAADASGSDAATTSELSADDPEIQALENIEVPDIPDFADMGTIKLCDLKSITVETSPKLVVDEDMVNSQIDYLRKQYMEETDGAAKEGDTVNIDYVGKVDGEEFDGGSATGYDLELGSGTFIDGFEDQLIGAKKGDKVTVNVTFPEDYSSTDLAGKDAVFDVTVNTVTTLPDLTDQWVKDNAEDMGSKASDVASFRVEQEKLLQAQVDYQYNNTIQQDALQQIVDASEITVSDKMQEYAEAYVISQEVQSVQQYGYTLADILNMYGMSVDDFKSEISEYAVDYAKQRMVVAAIADEQNIKSNDTLIDELAEQLSGLAGKELNKVQLIEQYGGDAVKDEAVNKAVLDYVQSQINIVETSDDETAAETEAEETSAEAASEAETETAETEG